MFRSEPQSSSPAQFYVPNSRDPRFDEWVALMTDGYHIPFALDTAVDEQPVTGGFVASGLPGGAGFELVRHAGSNQIFRRSRRHVSAAGEEYLFVSVGIGGRPVLTQEGRTAPTGPGQLTILDSALPSIWDGTDPFEMIIIQVPTRLLRAQPGLANASIQSATILPNDPAITLIANYFLGLASLRETAPEQANVLARTALDMISSLILFASGAKPVEAPADAFRREQVLAFLRNNFHNPDLTTAEIAAACHISTRTLFRLFDRPGESVGITLRDLRIRHSQRMLRQSTASPSAIAFAAGFTSERHFYRVFRQVTGMTPGEFRRGWH
ncbi:AraC family transcriptional regulator [Nocardia camponoti]|uniref:HTH araC/xylS-type domain-containing protein n=1 Tax=Nocardia camponoti TaxID=1616106 RepID=A0A917QLL7_9NOCA|nr:AraC family transcriptional regulator [Nocardia camponoti]GGK57305.1 hypothetical protein GCM10011591_31800 [Nocardia camponoti]